MKNYDVYFDRVNKKITLARANCDNSSSPIKPDNYKSEISKDTFEVEITKTKDVIIEEEDVPSNIYLSTQKHSKSKFDLPKTDTQFFSSENRFWMVSLIIILIMMLIIVFSAARYFWFDK